MKLLRYGEIGTEKPGLLDAQGNIRDLSGVISDICPQTLIPESLDHVRSLDHTLLPIIEGAPRLGPCVRGVGKFMCIGLNYADHAAETGAAIPEHPILFMKATSAINGPNDVVRLPKGSTHTDWEVELAAVIARPCKYVSADEALSYIAGYCIVNDISERHFQTGLTGQWTKGKSCDTFGPIGPWLVTADDIADPQNLNMRLQVNGITRQQGNSTTMIFSVAECIAHLSQLMTLHAGDIISTGTPPGVGMGIKPDPIYLKAGDVMELSIDGLGTQCQMVEQD